MSYEIVMHTAIDILARRRMTIRQITRRLCKKFPDEQPYIDRAIERLMEMGYLDDYAYAQAFARDRMKFRPRGKNFLKLELLKKGIEKEVIVKALDEIEIDENAMACVLFERYKKKTSFLKSKDRRNTLFRYFAQKGISFAAAQAILRENQSLF